MLVIWGNSVIGVKTVERDRETRILIRLLRAERQMLAAIAMVGLLAVALAVILGRQVNWPPFVIGYLATLGLAAIGGYIRQVKAAPRIAMALVGMSIFAGFTAVSTVFIFALFPLTNPLVDASLIRIDAAIGYHWPSFVGWLADFPAFAHLLGLLYHTSLLQISLTIILLAAMARELALHRFLAVGISTLTLAIAIWWVFPSVGPSALQTIPEADLLATGLYFNPGYGEYLVKLVEVGPTRITPEEITGVVAFPSYHMVMACMVVWFTRGTMAFGPALIANGAMVPATLTHGGHHFIDILGGLTVFFLGLWISHLLIRPVPAT